MILIADSGSTKTDWCFAEKGKEPIYASSMGINPYYQTGENIGEELAKTLKCVYDGPLSAIHYYGTGITGPAVAGQIEQIISHCYPSAGEITVSSDLIGAGKALYGKGEGIAVILGTGSNTGFFNGEGISEQLPPLGFWLGDEGSGGYLGKSFFKAYLRKELAADTVKLFHEKYGEMTRIQVLENAYQKPFPNRFFAKYAQFVIENKANDDCQKLINQNIEKLFARYILKYEHIQSRPLGFVGSIAFYLQDDIRVAAQKYGLQITKIIKKPINDLVTFHLDFT